MGWKTCFHCLKAVAAFGRLVWLLFVAFAGMSCLLSIRWLLQLSLTVTSSTAVAASKPMTSMAAAAMKQAPAETKVKRKKKCFSSLSIMGKGRWLCVAGTRTLRSDDTLHQNGIESGMTVRVLCRLRGGSGGNANVDIPGQWQCNFCHAIRCWPTRKRCYRCDTPRDFSNPNSPVRGPLGRAPQPARNNVPPTRSSGPGPQTVPPRNFGNGPPPGAGVGPMSTDVGEKDEGGDLVQALSLGAVRTEALSPSLLSDFSFATCTLRSLISSSTTRIRSRTTWSISR